MPRALKPEDRISHYRIVGPLGAGGMGEVYRARDQTLERDVALKVLPPGVIRSAERLRRFVLEAKSASSLNHPNIVTIYEIGQDRVMTVESGMGIDALGSEPDPDPLHFIAMELVRGTTLSAKFHHEGADLRTELGWLAQAAEGLAKAHAAGIVHRDLKPSNIMVSGDGYAKVLDFGLAKLVEEPSSDSELSAATTMTAGEQTSEGTVLGTVGYMAPEQVQGKAVDARADVFAFGCILYEAATRRRPFEADSKLETMHRILHDTPAPVEDSNPEAPAALRRLIRRCLAKDPNQRIQSMKDVALELREIVQDYATLSAPTNSGSGTRALPRVTRRGIPAWLGILATVAVVVVGWLAIRRLWLPPPVAPQPTWRQITFTGDVSSTALSGDGRTLSYVSGLRMGQRFQVQDVLGGRALEIYRALAIFTHQWTRDGSAILISAWPLDSPPKATIIPRMGGQGTTVPAIGYMRVSPDGGTLACWRSGGRRIDLMSMSGRDSSTIIPSPRFLWIWDVEWSPDGRKLAYLIADENHVWIWTTSRDGRRQNKVYEGAYTTDLKFLWAPRGGALYAIHQVDQRGELLKIYLEPDGSPANRTRVLISTPGLLATDFGVSDDGRRLACVRGEEHSNLWLWEPPRNGRPGTRPRALTQGSASLQAPALSPEGDRVAFVSNQSGSNNVHVLSLANGSSSQITFLDHDVTQAFWSPEGSELAFSAFDRETLRVWRVPAAGGTAVPLEHCILGDPYNIGWSPGGLAYGLEGNRNFLVVDPVTRLRRPLVANDSVGWMFSPVWSPDGKHVAVSWNRRPLRRGDEAQRGLWIIGSEDSTQRFLLPDSANLYRLGAKWSTNGRALYVVSNTPPWRVFRVGYPKGDTVTALRLPVDDDRTAPEAIDFTTDLRRVVYAVSDGRFDAWLLENFDPDVR